MELDVLRELQERGHFFWEMFPGADASDEWLRRREQIELNETTGGRQSPRVAADHPGGRHRTQTDVRNTMPDAVVLESERLNRRASAQHQQNIVSGAKTFRLQANMRRGTGSSLPGTWSSYASIDQARLAAREMLRDDRVVRVTVVTDTVPPGFVEWVNR